MRVENKITSVTKKTTFLLVLILLQFFFNSFALEVNKDELNNSNVSGPDAIIFENYSGSHSTIDSASAIRGIGISLGEELVNLSEKSVLGENQKYSIFHAVDSSNDKKLDADILILSDEALVDHIENLRRIIAGYLISAYDYSETDAYTLSVFITVYNAVYRNDIAYFEQKYKPCVTENLVAEKIGLAKNYTQWSGKTQIVIPLFDYEKGNLSTIETSIISEDNVIDAMRNEDDKNIDARKEMTNIKEKESKIANDNAKNAQKKVVEEQNKLKENENDLNNAKNEAHKAVKDANENPEDMDLRLNALDKLEKIDEINKKIDENNQNIEDFSKTVATEQQKADKKHTEVISERKLLIEDKNKLEKEANKNKNAPILFALKVTDEKKNFFTLQKINGATATTILESPVKVLRNRNFFHLEDKIISVAGEKAKNKAIKLVALDSEKMGIIAESYETVAETSDLVQSVEDENIFFYCTIQENSKYCIAKYDKNLKLIAKSSIFVKSSTPISVNFDRVCVTNEKGDMSILYADSLKDISF